VSARRVSGAAGERGRVDAATGFARLCAVSRRKRKGRARVRCMLGLVSLDLAQWIFDRFSRWRLKFGRNLRAMTFSACKRKREILYHRSCYTSVCHIVPWMRFATAVAICECISTLSFLPSSHRLGE